MQHYIFALVLHFKFRTEILLPNPTPIDICTMTWRHHAISQLIIMTAMITCRPAWNDNKYHSTNASMRASAVGAVLILKI